MNNSEITTLETKFRKSIIFVSILIPIVVAIFFSVKLKDFGIPVEPLSFLPPIYASINGVTAILLVAAVMAIKKGNRKLHERLMTAAIACSVVFLVMYVAYHMTSDSTKFGGEGWIKNVYFLILISHILLSIIIPIHLADIQLHFNKLILGVIRQYLNKFRHHIKLFLY